MLETLKKAYRKTKEVRIYKVKRKYQRLYQRDSEFSTFWAEFQALCTELGHDKSRMLEDLKDKLNPELQTATLSVETNDVYQYANKYITIEPKLKMIADNAKRYAKSARYIKVARKPPVSTETTTTSKTTTTRDSTLRTNATGRTSTLAA